MSTRTPAGAELSPAAVTVAEAARRTGLAGSGAALAALCARAGHRVDGLGGGRYVDLGVFCGADVEVEVEVGDIVVLETGRLT